MPKTQIEPCTKEEIDKIIEASMENDFYYLLFKVAAKTGRRLGEYYDVQVKDFDAESMILRTKVLKRRQKVYKDAILDEELTNLINIYIKRNHMKLDDYLFRKVSYRQIQYMITNYARKAGIKHKVSFHNFRHYFVTMLLKLGWSYDKISKLTGHSAVGTLAVYDHVVAKDIQDEARLSISRL